MAISHSFPKTTAKRNHHHQSVHETTPTLPHPLVPIVTVGRLKARLTMTMKKKKRRRSFNLAS
jgi:hypothetical protein